MFITNEAVKIQRVIQFTKAGSYLQVSDHAQPDNNCMELLTLLQEQVLKIFCVVK